METDQTRLEAQVTRGKIRLPETALQAFWETLNFSNFWTSNFFWQRDWFLWSPFGLWIRVLFYLGKKFWEGDLLTSAPKVFTHSWILWRVNSRGQDAQGSSWLKRRFSFYLDVISYSYSTCNVKMQQLVPPKFLSQHDLYPVPSSRPSLMSVYWQATSVFHFSLAIALG